MESFYSFLHITNVQKLSGITRIKVLRNMRNYIFSYLRYKAENFFIILVVRFSYLLYNYKHKHVNYILREEKKTLPIYIYILFTDRNF